MKQNEQPLHPVGRMIITSVNAIAHRVPVCVVVGQVCWCGWSPGGPRAAEGRYGCSCPCRGGHLSYGSGCSSRYPSDGICSSFSHSESGAVADSPAGLSGPSRYVTDHRLFSNKTPLEHPSLLDRSDLSAVLRPATGMQLPQGKTLTPAHLQMLRQQQLQQHQQQQQQQATSPQIKTVGKPQVHHQHINTTCNGTAHFEKCQSLFVSVG